MDERGELSSMYKGAPQNNVGIRTDILSNISKSIGMKMMIRSMAPKVIVADEIGSKSDVEAINYALCSGVKGLFTAHGNDIENLKSNNAMKKMIDDKLFERIIILDISKKGEIAKVYELSSDTEEYNNIYLKKEKNASFKDDNFNINICNF